MTGSWRTSVTIVGALCSHYRYHPWQSLFLLVGLVAGVALWSAVQLVNAEAIASYDSANRISEARIVWRIEGEIGNGVPVDAYIALRRSGFTSLFPVIEEQVQLEGGATLRIIASDLLVMPGAVDEDEGAVDTWLELIQPPYQMTLSAATADTLRVGAGARLQLRNGEVLPPVSIRSSAGTGEAAFMDIAAARALFPQYEAHDLFSYLATGELTETQRLAIIEALPPGLNMVADTTVPDLRLLTRSLHQHLQALGFLAFVVGIFIVFSAQRFALVYRQQTFSILRDLGLSFRWLLGGILVETLIWSVVGTVSGLLAGYVMAQALLPQFASTVSVLYGAALPTNILLRSETIVTAWLLSFFGLIIALAGPVLARLLQHDPDRHFKSPDYFDPIIGILGTAICLVGGFILMRGIEDAWIGFLALGLILSGMAMLLPFLLPISLAAASHVGLAVGSNGAASRAAIFRRWLAGEGKAQLPALKPAMMALLIALSAAGGISLMIDSFRMALEDWLAHRLSADIYISQHRTDGNQHDDYVRLRMLLTDGLEKGWLAAAHQRIGVETRWLNKPTEIRGLELATPDSRSLPLAQGSLDDWLNHDPADPQPYPVLVNEQVSHFQDIQVGDDIAVEVGHEAVRMRVTGVFYDYGNPGYAFYLPASAMKAHWPNAREMGTALWLNLDVPDADHLAETALIQSGIPAAQWRQQAYIRAQTLSVFDRTFLITATLNTLTLSVAGIAILAALIGLMHQRLPEFALWQALGLSRIEIARLTTLPLLSMAGLTWLLSIPLGLALAWSLVDRINIVSFGWSMPLNLSVMPFLQLGVMTLVVVLSALVFVQLRLRQQLAKAMSELGADE